MVDEEDKRRFEKQLDAMQAAQAEPINGACCPGVESLSQAMCSLVRTLVSITSGLSLGMRFLVCAMVTRRTVTYTPITSEPARSRDGSLKGHSLKGRLERELEQTRAAKAAEWHAAAIVLLLLVLLPLLPLLLPLISLCYCRYRKTSKAAVTELSSSKVATQSEEHVERVVKLLIDQGTIGMGEAAQKQVSMITTLRYAVLRMAQSFAYYCVSARSFFSGLAAGLTCTVDDNDKLPEGATKYLVVEFNAWVYSGVRRCART